MPFEIFLSSPLAGKGDIVVTIFVRYISSPQCYTVLSDILVKTELYVPL